MKVFLIIISLFAVNCISGANKQFMNPRLNFPNPIINTISVDQTKGAYMSFSSGLTSWSQKVNDDTLKETLIESLIESGLINKLDSGSNLKLNSEITLLQLDATYLVIDAKVTSKVSYKLIYNQKIIKTFEIQENALVLAKDEFFGGVRVKRAIELSMQNNIRAFLIELSKMKFDNDLL